MSAGSVLTLGYGPSGSASKILRLGYGGDAVVEPPESGPVPIPIGVPLFRRPDRQEGVVEVVHAKVYVSGGGDVMVFGHKGSEQLSSAEKAYAFVMMMS